MTIWNILTPVATAILTWIGMWVFKPWAGAYGGEKGKNLARREDLDVILAEVRAVTITQKEIEQKLSGDLWTKQTVWTQKRDIYIQLLKSIQNASSAYANLVPMLEIKESKYSECAHKPLDDLISTQIQKIVSADADVINSVALGLIFLSPECESTLNSFSNTVADTGSVYSASWAYTNRERRELLFGSIVKLAKADLHAQT